MSTFFSGAGTRLYAGIQGNYFDNRDTSVNVPLNITSVTLDPTVEKGTEENLLSSRVKDSSYLLSIGMDGSLSMNLRPEMVPWVFRAGFQNIDFASGAADPSSDSSHYYGLSDAGTDPVGSTLVLDRPGEFQSQQAQALGLSNRSTYPGMTVRSMTLTCPNNDFVTVDMDLAGREEINGDQLSAIPSRANPETHYVQKTGEGELTKAGYIMTDGHFIVKMNVGGSEQTIDWCIESCTITIDNGLEDSPRCYQDGRYANIPVMGRRSISLDISVPYNDAIEMIKQQFLLSNATASCELSFTSADSTDTAYDKITVYMPSVSITSIGAGISGTGVIEASVGAEAIEPNGTALGSRVWDNPDYDSEDLDTYGQKQFCQQFSQNLFNMGYVVVPILVRHRVVA